MGHCKSNHGEVFSFEKKPNSNIDLNLIAADIYAGLYNTKKEEDLKSEK
tara:strand:- start:31 stop:177 length:147 start_codon:yes stop_codon:yes gene_type:complete